jgi:hypothetical protein
MKWYLFSKEENYKLPEVYKRTYVLKQLDEKFIPSTIARTEDIPSIEGLATEEYVDTKVSDLVNTAPEALDTLKELSTALGDDPNFATTVLTQLGNKADKDDIPAIDPTLTIEGAAADAKAVGDLWSNIPTDADVWETLINIGLYERLADESGNVLTDEVNAILLI